jgi:phage tail-like protein
MRATVEDLCSPLPLIDTMPLVYRGDFFAERLCAAFDELLAPIFATLDCFAAYLDPKTAPSDMLDWLAGWIGLVMSGHEQPPRKRELSAAGAALLPLRGTARSVHEAVVAAFNRETEVIESGSATWSTTPDSKPAGQPLPSLIVRVTVDSDDDIDQRSLDALVDLVKPAHIPHRVEVVTRPTPVAVEMNGEAAELSRVEEEPPTISAGSDTTMKIALLGADVACEAPPPTISGDGDASLQGGDL